MRPRPAAPARHRAAPSPARHPGQAQRRAPAAGSASLSRASSAAAVEKRAAASASSTDILSASASLALRYAASSCAAGWDQCNGLELTAQSGGPPLLWPCGTPPAADARQERELMTRAKLGRAPPAAGSPQPTSARSVRDGTRPQQPPPPSARPRLVGQLRGGQAHKGGRRDAAAQHVRAQVGVVGVLRASGEPAGSRGGGEVRGGGAQDRTGQERGARVGGVGVLRGGAGAGRRRARGAGRRRARAPPGSELRSRATAAAPQPGPSAAGARARARTRLQVELQGPELLLVVLAAGACRGVAGWARGWAAERWRSGGGFQGLHIHCV